MLLTSVLRYWGEQMWMPEKLSMFSHHFYCNSQLCVRLAFNTGTQHQYPTPFPTLKPDLIQYITCPLGDKWRWRQWPKWTKSVAEPNYWWASAILDHSISILPSGPLPVYFSATHWHHKSRSGRWLMVLVCEETAISQEGGSQSEGGQLYSDHQ
jgi:hypothetical protein